MKYIAIACRFTQGMVLKVPGHDVTLNGTRTEGAMVVPSKDGTEVAVTRIDEELWNRWKAIVTPWYPPLRAGAIFEYNAAALEDNAQKKTILEGFDPANPPAGLDNPVANTPEYKDEVSRENSLTRRAPEEKDTVAYASSKAEPPVAETRTDTAYMQMQATKEERAKALEESKAASGK